MDRHYDRPWGWFEILVKEDNYCVKKIYVKPNQRFSLQYHNHRSEHWVVIQGDGVALVNNYEERIGVDKQFYIPRESKHRLTGGENGITFIETQIGECNEDDIIRLEDDYGRDCEKYYFLG